MRGNWAIYFKRIPGNILCGAGVQRMHMSSIYKLTKLWRDSNRHLLLIPILLLLQQQLGNVTVLFLFQEGGVMELSVLVEGLSLIMLLFKFLMSSLTLSKSE